MAEDDKARYEREKAKYNVSPAKYTCFFKLTQPKAGDDDDEEGSD